MPSDRKRKQDGRSFIEGLFTRSKSRVYLHCNRSGRARADSTRCKPKNHQFQQLGSPVKKSRRLLIQNLEGSSSNLSKESPLAEVQADSGRHLYQNLEGSIDMREMSQSGHLQPDLTLSKPPIPIQKSERLPVQNLEGSVDICEMPRTSIKDLRAHRVFSPASIDLEDINDNVKKSESPLLEEKISEEDKFGEKKDDELGQIGTESNGSSQNSAELICEDASVPKSKPAVSLSLRKKVFIGRSSFSYRRLLPYLMDAAKENSDVSGVEVIDKTSKSNDPTLSYLKPDVQSMASNGSKEDLPSGVTKAQLVPQVSSDPEALEECVQATPPDPDIVLCKADMSAVVASIEHKNVQETEKDFAGHPSYKRNGCIIKKSSLSPVKNGSVLRNKSVLNPCSRLKVFKASSSPSYRRLLPFLMDVANNGTVGASSENRHPKLLSITKEASMNKESSPNKEETKEQETNLLEPKSTSANDVTVCLNTCLSTEVLSPAPCDVSDSQNVEVKGNTETPDEMTKSQNVEAKENPETPDDVINSHNVEVKGKPETPDDVANSQNIEVEGKAETKFTGTRITEKSEPECSFNNFSGEALTGDFRVGSLSPVPSSIGDFLSETDRKVPNPMSLSVDDMLSESAVELPNAEPISSIGKCMTLEVDFPEEQRNSIKLPGLNCGESLSTAEIQEDASKAIDEIPHMSEPELINGEPLEPAICYHKSTANEASYDLATKGILKRNPRGCRGLCNCLNCASFRLHAERAFEFSRNQMQDSEEVALGLMKEMSSIRIFLEKHLSSENNLPPIPLTQVEIKEACMKASEAEQLAKERLTQMNNELHYHCRITTLHRPRVTFDSHVDTQDIPQVESSSSKHEKEDGKAKTKRYQKKHQ